MMPTAVILAAGLGSRLREANPAGPKGLVAVGAGPIIGRSLRLLQAAGVDTLIMVVGWEGEAYRSYLAENFPAVRVVENPAYATTGSLASLVLGVNGVEDDVLVVESDLIFERQALAQLLAAPSPDTLLASGFTRSEDEVWVHAEAGRLVHLTKGAWPGAPRHGELVGLTRLSRPTVRALREVAAQLPPAAHYEDGLNAVCAGRAIDVLKLEALQWCEIDTPAHWRRARELVWPAILAADESAPVGALPPRKRLLNPGPGTTSDAVKRALLAPDICPREAEFGRVLAQVRRDLLAVAGCETATHTAVLVGGPGTAGVEAALGSLVPAGGRVLIVENGAYGERAAAIARVLGISARVWRCDWLRRPDAAAFAAELEAGGCTHACWVHHETTTGLLNPLEEFGEVCRRRGVVSIVDAMSSFAGLDLAWGRLPVDAWVSSANKCLQGMPGLSFVIVRRDVLAAAASVARSVALDLHGHERSQGSGQFPFTPPVQVVYALAEALRETQAETVPGRAARYRACYETMLAGMEALGFRALLPRALHSGLLTTFATPDWRGFTFDGLHDHLYARGITLYPGKLAGCDTFRVANIGALTPADLHVFLAEVKKYRDAL